MLRPSRDLIALAAACGSGLAVLPAVAEPRANCPGPRESSEEFIGGSHAVAFQPSTRYETVTFVSDSGAPLEPRSDDVSELSAALKQAKVGIVLEGPSLRQFGSVLVRLDEGVTPEQVQHAIGRNLVAGGDRTKGNGNPIFDAGGGVDHVLVNQIIVQFHSSATQDDISKLLAQYCAHTVEVSEGKGGSRHLLTFEGQTARHALAMVNRLNREKIVQFAQPDVIVIATDRIASGLASGAASCPAGPATPGVDPYFPQQWFLDHSSGQPGDPAADINAREAWVAANGANIVVAILDDAIETTHEDLQGKIASTWNAYTETGALGITDGDVHGTPVAGIVGAMTENAAGVKGTAPQVNLMAVRVVRWIAPGIAEYPYSVVVNGIEKATAAQAQVISMSLSLGAEDLDSCDTRGVCQSAVRSAVDAAIAGGAVPVFAVGNDGASSIAFPAKLAGSTPVIAVGATDNFDQIKALNPLVANDWGSNQGPEISVVAPGLDVVTTDRTAAQGSCSGNYVSFLGTSAATPVVAGVAGLMQSQYLAQGLPPLSPQALKDRLQQTAKDLGATGFDNTYGHGRVDACKAMQAGSCGQSKNPWLLLAAAVVVGSAALYWWVRRMASKKSA